MFQIYSETDLQRTKLDLLSNTNMVDFAMDIQDSLYPDQPVPIELTDKRTKVVAELKRLQVSCYISCIIKGSYVLSPSPSREMSFYTVLLFFSGMIVIWKGCIPWFQQSVCLISLCLLVVTLSQKLLRLLKLWSNDGRQYIIRIVLLSSYYIYMQCFFFQNQSF